MRKAIEQLNCFWNVFSLFNWSWKNSKGSREASEACAGKTERLREIKSQVELVSAKNYHTTPARPPRHGPAGGGARARVARLCPSLNLSNETD